MYESFYGLREKPFSFLPDPDYLYMGQLHALAYTVLESSLKDGVGFTVMTGDVGCGKTTLIRHLLNNIDQKTTVGLISNTSPDIDDLLKWVLLAFNQPYESSDKVSLFDQLQHFLTDQHGKGRRTALIIDEAQNLSRETLEELRVLSNFNAYGPQLLQVLLVGQPQLKTLLRGKDMEQLAQRVSSDFHIGPLFGREVADYIVHRLRVAGREEPLFEETAVELIAAVSEGVPRKVNYFSDMAMFYGHGAGKKMVTASLVSEVLLAKANDIFPTKQQPFSDPLSEQDKLPGRTHLFNIDRFTRKLFPALAKK